MGLNSINTNIAAIRAQTNILQANQASTSSISRLSSGERITRAADDVAALSAGTSLETNVVTLRTALVNSFQGQSLLQVADGALAQITDILQRQKSIAVQAGAGSLTSAERGFLNQEFQQLSNEANRLATETNFNGVTILDGSLDDRVFIEENTEAALSGRASLGFTAIAEGQTVILNGVTAEFDIAGDGINAGNQLAVTTPGSATTVADFVNALASALNTSTLTRISEATYEALGSTLIITSRAGGVAAEEYSIDMNQSTTTFITNARTTNETNVFVLNVTPLGTDGDLGLSTGDVIGNGTVGDSIIAAQQQTKSFGGVNFSNSALTDFADGDILNFDDGDVFGGGNVLFEFDSDGTLGAANRAVIDISRATTKTEMIEAIVEAVNSYVGIRADGSDVSDEYLVRQLRARREGDNVIFETRDVGGLEHKADLGGPPGIVTTPFSIGTANAVYLGSRTFNNGVTTGVRTSVVTNSDFIGTLQGFRATYEGFDNRASLELTVGERTYRATNIDMTSDATVRFITPELDFFDIDFQGATNNIQVRNQDEADTVAARLDKAFAGLTFYQNRDITSFNAVGDITSEGEYIGSLNGSLISLNRGNASAAQVSDVRVSAPLEGTTNGIIEFDIGGQTYRSRADIGSELYSGSIYRFSSLDDPNALLTFQTGDINGLGLTRSDGTVVDSIEFDTTTKAAKIEAVLKEKFGIGQAGQAVGFQVGTESDDELDITLPSVTTDVLFGGQIPDVLTSESAITANELIDAAIDIVTSVRAEVGSLQSRFDFASNNIESAIANQDAARGVLLDTDVASESTAFATATVQLQAGVAVLAQANLQSQNLLKLIG